MGAAPACCVTVRTSTTGEGSGCESEETSDGGAVADAETVADDDRTRHPGVYSMPRDRRRVRRTSP
jgi:hypothetical protein